MFLVIILIFLSFLQGSGFPINLILLIIIARSLVASDKANLWLAFSFGIFLSYLLNLPLGVLSLLYLLIVAVIYAIKKTNFAFHPLVLTVLSLVFIILDHLTQQLGGNLHINYLIISVEMVLVFPIFLAVRFWEERFIPKGDVKLKMGK